MTKGTSVTETSVAHLIKILKENPGREKDLKLLANAFFNNLDRYNCEYGGWGVDDKRPFGNSFVEGDIAEIIGLELVDEDDDSEEHEDQIRYLNSLYDDLGPYLKYKWEKLNRKNK
jgi:hypothetical protein